MVHRHNPCIRMGGTLWDAAGHSLGAALALLFAQAAHVQSPELAARIAAVYCFGGMCIHPAVAPVAAVFRILQGSMSFNDTLPLHRDILCCAVHFMA